MPSAPGIHPSLASSARAPLRIVYRAFRARVEGPCEQTAHGGIGVVEAVRHLPNQGMPIDSERECAPYCEILHGWLGNVK